MIISFDYLHSPNGNDNGGVSKTCSLKPVFKIMRVQFLKRRWRVNEQAKRIKSFPFLAENGPQGPLGLTAWPGVFDSKPLRHRSPVTLLYSKSISCHVFNGVFFFFSSGHCMLLLLGKCTFTKHLYLKNCADNNNYVMQTDHDLEWTCLHVNFRHIWLQYFFTFYLALMFL